MVFVYSLAGLVTLGLFKLRHLRYFKSFSVGVMQARDVRHRAFNRLLEVARARNPIHSCPRGLLLPCHQVEPLRVGHGNSCNRVSSMKNDVPSAFSIC